MDYSNSYVAVGCDSNQEWMIPWWYTNFKKHNPSLSVIFGDFGMTVAMKSWCREHGKVINVGRLGHDNRCNWFRKPAFLASLSCIEEYVDASIIYMDNDCEVLGDVSDLFQYCKSVNEVALRNDVTTQFNSHIHNPIQTGVMVFKVGNELIDNWADECYGDRTHRGDQELLDTILTRRLKDKDFTTKINIFPNIYNRLRLEGNPIVDETVIMHWTGPIGKDTIKDIIKRGNR